MIFNFKKILPFVLMLSLVFSCGHKEDDPTSGATNRGSITPLTPIPPVPTPLIPTPESAVISIPSSFNRVVYLVNENGNVSAKNAQNQDGLLTTGGVTGKSGDLTQFIIPILSLGDLTTLTINPSKESDLFCTMPTFSMSSNSISIKNFGIQNTTELKSATNCSYEVIDLKKNKIAEFNVLFNRTFQDYCTDSTDISTYETSQTILSVMGITSGCFLSDTSLSINKIITEGNKGITDLSPFSGFINLINLEFYNHSGLLYAGISKLPNGIFDNLTLLETLDIGHNQISAIPNGVFDKLTHLNILVLYYNKISQLPFGIFDKLSQVKRLLLSGNELTEIPTGIFDKLTSLNELDLDNNQITKLPNGIFDKISTFQSLLLNNNQLTEIPKGIFDKNVSMINLFLNNNYIDSLPSGLFDKLVNLYQIELNNNRLSILPDNIFNLKILSYLDLSSNQFSSIPDLVLSRCPHYLAGATCTIKQ